MAKDERDILLVVDDDAINRTILEQIFADTYTVLQAENGRAGLAESLEGPERLCAVLRGHNRRLYLPESCAGRVPGSIAVVGTAISGGSFRQRLEEAVSAFGGGRLALDVRRLTMDFSLPSPSGEGAPISPQQLRELLEELRPNTFYSRDLCAKYFTYTRAEQAHFVLFDDADTIRRKLHTGQNLGFSAAFLLYPECVDLLGPLFAER